jgi:probable HAF family extracellular repeat protein
MSASQRVRIIVVFALLVGIAQASAAEFHGLGSPDLFVQTVHGVSSDGAIAVGSRWHPVKDAAHAVMWKDGVVTDLGTLGGRRSWASKITADGLIVGGSDDGSGNSLAVYWRAGAITPLRFRPDAPDHDGSANGVSADGSVIVGTTSLGSAPQAFRWVMDSAGKGVMTPLGVSDGRGSEALDASADGSVVVGFVYYSSDRVSQLAFRWVKAAGEGTMTVLRSGRDTESAAQATSSNGAVVVGFREIAPGRREAFRWERGVMTGLGALRGGEFVLSEASAVSGDGNVIVGDAENASGALEAFRWTKADGMKSVSQLLEAAGIRLDGWYLNRATAVSKDGRVILGNGRNPADKEQAWRAVIDLPASRP